MTADPDDLLDDLDAAHALIVEARQQLSDLLRNARGASGASFPRDRATDPAPDVSRTAASGAVPTGVPDALARAAATSAARDTVTEARTACLWAWEPAETAPKRRRNGKP